MFKQIARGAALALCVLAAGCAQELSPAPAPALPQQAVEAAPEPAAPVGSGRVETDLEEGSLTPEQTALLQRFMDGYYQALARLQAPEGMDGLFASDAAAQQSLAGLTWQLGLRTLTEGADYSLVSWQYRLRCTAARQEADGSVTVQAQEDNTQIFAQTPGIESRQYGVHHSFTLTPGPKGWRIAAHSSFDALYLTTIRQGGWEDLEARYAAAVPAFLEANRAAAAALGAQREAGPLPSADHPYDRQAALDYARQYTAARNPAWDDYAGMGGNCQNYVSQCLYAGGIPMDTTGAAVWKWFDGTVANDTTAAGRSSSWSGVDEFLAYAEGNTGYGLAAQTGAPYLTGQPGELIQMGENGSWRHVVIISQTVTDESGQTIDYLVHSNTSNLENWPASLYGYPQRLLTRIAGWND